MNLEVLSREYIEHEQPLWFGKLIPNKTKGIEIDLWFVRIKEVV